MKWIPGGRAALGAGSPDHLKLRRHCSYCHRRRSTTVCGCRPRCGEQTAVPANQSCCHQYTGIKAVRRELAARWWVRFGVKQSLRRPASMWCSHSKRPTPGHQALFNAIILYKRPPDEAVAYTRQYATMAINKPMCQESGNRVLLAHAARIACIAPNHPVQQTYPEGITSSFLCSCRGHTCALLPCYLDCLRNQSDTFVETDQRKTFGCVHRNRPPLQHRYSTVEPIHHFW